MVDASQILDEVVDGALAAHGKDGVRDFESYLFVGLVRKAARLFRRERKVEYRSPEDLAALEQTVDTDWVRKLEIDLQVKELISLMDERTRCIYVSGYSIDSTNATYWGSGAWPECLPPTPYRGLVPRP